MTVHTPVLLQQTIDGLDLKLGDTVIDATLGGGGHTALIGKLVGKTGSILAVDRDSQTLKEASLRLKALPCQKIFKVANFSELETVWRTSGLNQPQAIIFDLGLSSDQLEQSGRGFSFSRSEPLMMTFNTKPHEEDLTAWKIVNYWSEKEIKKILIDFGEERFADRIAFNIIRARKKSSINTTDELVEIIKQVIPVWYQKRRLHFATKTFQALRIAVNDELKSLEQGLVGAWTILKPTGRLAVISFHGLEAKMIKNFFRQLKQAGQGELITKKVIKPDRQEILSNPRSRSAQLRIIKKL